MSQIYLAVISIITLPALVKYMGPESYGLVGFFSLIQSWLILLDLGMSPTLSREISRFRGGALNANSLIYLFNTLKKIFVFIAIGCALAIILFSNVITNKWLKIESLDHDMVVSSIVLMGLVVACRWVLGIYKSGVTGFEKLVWLSIFNTIFATLRFVVIFPVFLIAGVSPLVFFTYQLIVSILELIIIVWYVKRLMPSQEEGKAADSSLLKNVLRFSLTIAFTGAMWIISTQTDKLVLSKMLRLSEFGYYTLAVQLASGITLISGPISTALLPRLAKLEAERRHEEMIALYRFCTQCIAIIVGSVSLVMIFFSRQILFAWTGDPVITGKVVPYLVLYAIGNFILALAAFPFYLQYAKGNLRFHFIGNILFPLFLIPSLIYLVNKLGGIGAGYVWIAINLLYFLVWIPFIHYYFEKGLNRKWYFNDIFMIIIPVTLWAYVCRFLIVESESRYLMMLQLIIIGISILVLSTLLSSMVRPWIMGRISKLMAKRTNPDSEVK